MLKYEDHGRPKLDQDSCIKVDQDEQVQNCIKFVSDRGTHVHVSVNCTNHDWGSLDSDYANMINLVKEYLTRANYHSWFRDILMALKTKNKLQFIDGSLPKSNLEDPNFGVWDRCNTIVMSSIKHSLDRSICQSVHWLKTTYDIWKDLKERKYGFPPHYKFNNNVNNVTSFGDNDMTNVPAEEENIIGFILYQHKAILDMLKEPSSHTNSQINIMSLADPGSDLIEIQFVKQLLDKKFSITDIGNMKYFLGMEVVTTKGGISLFQRKYTIDLLQDAGLLAAKSASTSMDNTIKLPNPTAYRRLSGRLIYLTHTRPTISYDSKRQMIVSRSFTEAEYRALAHALAPAKFCHLSSKLGLCDIHSPACEGVSKYEDHGRPKLDQDNCAKVDQDEQV
ncbi:PREDICTED: uncharacterized protein LOC109357954 [Lupinus angustifolius]|uniref:uncharacterized protein LOC109357954 n=1 Tax=Lupinus angustifolius TaxID=3871 RepID=UPI00092E2A78|nr:PREDICTED: uncharacterized protein LOC109357954 [Lupinus angustifolius]